MRNSKKILLFTLALSSLLLAQASTDNIPSNDYNKLQNTMTENFNSGVSNNKNYDLIVGNDICIKYMEEKTNENVVYTNEDVIFNNIKDEIIIK